ncbi:beta-galactosidase [Thaumasiovibrio sp. DFM-14]|uniref:beta-galactosidase n=1 Tax=Thaumasiovibrio sp. DFM-14 TaxID=3384792 RepID=UPI0039A26CBC
MHFNKNSIVLAIIASTLAAGSIAATKTPDTPSNGATQQDMSSAVQKVVMTDERFLSKAANTHASYNAVGENLEIVFDAISESEVNSKWPNVKFHPESGSYDWNTKGGLQLTLENPGDQEARIEIKVSDNIGIMGAAAHQLDLPIYLPAGKTTTVDFLFNGTEMNIEGYRGGSELDLRNIAEFQFYAVGPIAEQKIVVHDIDFIERTGDFVLSEARQGQVIESQVPTLLTITDFESGMDEVVEYYTGTNVDIVNSDMGSAIKVHYTTDEDYPTIKFSAGKNGEAWDWSKYGDVALAFDAKNVGDSGMQLFVRVDDALDEKLGGTATGAVNSRTGYVQIAANSEDKYYFTFKDLAEGLDSGMRGEPPKKSFSASQVIFGWGESELDLSNIVSVQLYMMNPQKEATLVIDNFSLIPNLSTDTTRYTSLLDEFGQYQEETWPEKVTDVAQLKAQARVDKELLKSASLMDDRSKYGGWSKGPKFEATGYFRTEKVDGKWALVDPEGYLYFATGVDNIRMDDSYTVTGMDFADAVEADTKGMRPSQVATERYVDDKRVRVEASPLRRGMFEWLPDFGDPLADNYSYTQMIHTGPIKHGELFSFYSANLQRKYDTDSAQEAIEIWKDVTLARMQDWGFTSLGNWSDPMYRKNDKVPYTAHGWITGDHQRVSTGNDYWWAMHDPFDPQFRVSVATMAKELGEEVDKDPWCIGYFVDNELSWGNTVNDTNHYALAVSGLRESVEASSSKAAFDRILKEKYGSIEKFNEAWGTDVTSWKEFGKGFNYQGAYTDAVKADLSVLLDAFADKFFAVVSEEMGKVLPNHLYMGVRFSDWGVTPEAASAAARYVDVMSYNLYATDLNAKGDWSHLPELDKPSIIGEFHFGSTDSGLFHPGIISSDNQKGRAESYAQYMESVIDNPYFVGAHWFQYMDSPVTGRAWDGENYNVGFVTVTDTPYEPLVESAKEVNRNLYNRRFGNLN